VEVFQHASTRVSKFEVTLRLMVNQYVLIQHPRGTCDQVLLPVGMLLPEICGLLSVGRPLCRDIHYLYSQQGIFLIHNRLLLDKTC
jgi:hypothetical protein